METVNGAIMKEIKFRLGFNDTELNKINKMLIDISQNYNHFVFEIISVNKEGSSLLLLKTRALKRESCGMYYPVGIYTNFVIDIKNNKWGTYKEITTKVYSWDK